MPSTLKEPYEQISKNDTTTGIKISQIYSGKDTKNRKINRVDAVLIQNTHPVWKVKVSIGLLSY